MRSVPITLLFFLTISFPCISNAADFNLNFNGQLQVTGGGSAPANSSPLGVNFPEMLWYEGYAGRVFTDIMKHSDRLKFSSLTDPHRSDGYPNSLSSGANASTIVQTDVFGRYVGFCDGSGSFSVSSPGAQTVLVNCAGANHRFEFDVVSGNPAAMVTLTITATTPSDPVRYIRLIMPGFESTYLTDNVFHPDFINQMKIFGTIRFMGAQYTNNTDLTYWADRPTIYEQTQGGSFDNDKNGLVGLNKGMALEHMIDMANRTGSQPWFNIPHTATDDFVKQFMTMVRDRLNPALSFYVEWSNETWNGIFKAHNYCKDAGLQAGFDTAATIRACNRYHAFRTESVCDMARDVFVSGGADPQRIICVDAGQMANTDPDRLTWMRDGTEPFNFKYALAPYFGTHLSDNEILAGGKTAVLDDTEQYLNNTVIPMMSTMSDFVASKSINGHNLIAYEWGTAYTAKGLNADAVMSILHDANIDTARMPGIIETWLNGWKNAKGETFCYFKFSGGWDTFGDWSLFYNINKKEARTMGLENFFNNNNKPWWP